MVKNRSCSTNLTFFFDKVTKLENPRNAANIVHLYFSEAFDKGDHNLFLGKIEKCGIENMTTR